MPCLQMVKPRGEPLRATRNRSVRLPPALHLALYGGAATADSLAPAEVCQMDNNPGPRFGYIASDIVESAKSEAWLSLKSLPHIWYKEMRYQLLHLQSARAIHSSQVFALAWVAALVLITEWVAHGLNLEVSDESWEHFSRTDGSG